MAHRSDHAENYWPGYVDALTSMVQVLAFVMMLLAMSIFVLSQNISRAAVQAIASALKLDLPENFDVNAATQNILEEIQKLKAEKKSPTVEEDGDKMQRKPNVANLDLRTKDAKPGQSGRPVRAPVEDDIAPLPNTPRAKIQFPYREFKADSPIVIGLQEYLSAHEFDASKSRMIIRAFALSNDGSITEARRIAYYRGMAIRKELVQRQIRPEDIRIVVLDTPSRDEGLLVEVYSRERPASTQTIN